MNARTGFHALCVECQIVKFVSIMYIEKGMKSSASLAQLAEHALRKRMVTGSIPVGGFSAIGADALHVKWPGSEESSSADCRSVIVIDPRHIISNCGAPSFDRLAVSSRCRDICPSMRLDSMSTPFNLKIHLWR